MTHRLEDAPKRRLQKMAIAWNLQDVVFSKSVDGSSSHDVNTTMIFKVIKHQFCVSNKIYNFILVYIFFSTYLYVLNIIFNVLYDVKRI